MAKVTKKPAKKVKKNPLAMHSAAGKAELQRLRNLQMDQFGAPGDQAYLVHLAKLVGTGKAASGAEDWKVKAGRATRDKDALRAGKTVQAELNPQIAASKNYQKGLGVLYANLANNQAATANLVANGQAATKSAIGGDYDQLASQIASEFNSSRENSNSELSRLGIGMGDASQSGAVQGRIAGLADAGKANALSQQDASGQGYSQLMGLLQNESAATGAGLSQAASQQQGQLEASRSGKVYSLWQQLADARKATDAETAQQRFLNQIAQAKFGSLQDFQSAQSLAQLAKARKDIVDSKRPSTKKVKKVGTTVN